MKNPCNRLRRWITGPGYQAQAIDSYDGLGRNNMHNIYVLSVCNQKLK